MEEVYELTDFKSIGVSKKKNQIILCDTKRNYSNYISSLKYRYNKKNPYLPNYVISKEGKVFEIIKPLEYSKFMEDEELDKNAIIICLENLGWFKKNPIDNTYVSWIGDIYNKKVFEKKWRDNLYWDLYSDDQISSLSELIKKLCNEYKIKRECFGTNVKYDNIKNFNGIVSRSNFEFLYKDVNPSFNFELLKKLIEND